jgi:FMN phosphatase YigB (HAD superfamily)
MDKADLAIMLDVDNTLLDNDRAKQDIDAGIRDILGPAEAERFWQLYEAVREETGVVDFPKTLTWFQQAYDDSTRFAALEHLLTTFPYANYLYPGTMETLAHFWTLGTVAIVSDGDPVFQAYKIRVSGLEEAVRGNVLLFDHKDEHLDEIRQRLPAGRYVMVDDKDRILDNIKRTWGRNIVTVHVCQGKYAADPDLPPDIEVDHIADLRACTAADFHPRSS